MFEMATKVEGIQAERYLTTLAEMEHNWQSAVDKALSVREDQLATAKQVIATLRAQLQQQETRLEAKEKEVDCLKGSLLETQMNLDSSREDLATLLESSQKQLEVQNLEHLQQLEAKDREMDELRSRHKQSIQELARGARDTLQELETQVEALKLSEAEGQKRLAEAQETTRKQARSLKDWDRVSEKMSMELDDAKGKLKGSKFANGKLRDEITLWKKYAEKVEEERKTIHRDIELEKKVLQKFNQVDSFLRTERQHRNIILNSMNNFGMNLMKDIKLLHNSSRLKEVYVVSGTQTEPPSDWEEKDDVINILKRKSSILEKELTNKENDMENLFAQNATLKEVILGMKKERENWEKEREQIDEEVRVTKLEESVRLIKNNLINDQKDICVWNALQGVKKEVSELKNRKVHNTAMIASLSGGADAPTVFGKQVITSYQGKIPAINEYASRNRYQMKF